jgi:two-component system, NarL family, sensor histidine kinase UhpB
MKILISSFTLLVMVLSCFAQKADSLEAVLRNTKMDSSKSILLSLLADELSKSNPKQARQHAEDGLMLARRIGFDKGIFENLFSIGMVLQGQAKFDSAIVSFREAFAIAQKRKDVKGQAEICSSLGHSFMRKNRMDSSRFYLERGLTLAKEIKDFRTEAGIYNNYGNVFLEESQYQKALDNFIASAKLYEKVADDYGQCLALSNIGNVEYRLGNFELALDYGRQSLAIAKRKSFTSSIGYAYKLLGRIYRKQTKFDSALVQYKNAQKFYAGLGDTRSSAELLQNIGNIYFDKGQHHDALVNYQESLKLSKAILVKPVIAFAYSAIGQALHALKRNDEALHYLDSSIVAAKEIGNGYLIMDTYQAISLVHEARGDFKKALSIHQRFVEIKDSITQSENRQLAEDTQAKYELEKKEAQIALLTKDQELKSLALARQRAIQVGTAIALGLVIVIALLLVNRYRVVSKAKRQSEIEKVRNTIARDLHDDIGSTLSTINIISNLAMRENATGDNKHLSRIAEQSSRIMENMSDMVWSINPINDSMERVAVKMKTFAGEILEPKNMRIKFHGEESLNGLSLDPEKRKNLFLIFKEAINNAAKYSGANEVEIQLNQSNGKLTMRVKDNGNGFDEHQKRSGNGLRNMRDRAQAMQAELMIETNMGKGTEVKLEMPII